MTHTQAMPPAVAIEPRGTAVPSTVPTHWYNLAADLPEPVPPHLNPGTGEQIGRAHV